MTISQRKIVSQQVYNIGVRDKQLYLENRVTELRRRLGNLEKLNRPAD